MQGLVGCLSRRGRIWTFESERIAESIVKLKEIIHCDEKLVDADVRVCNAECGEARKFKDFWRANLGHAAAAVTSFVNVNVINVSGMAGMSEIVKHTDV